MHEPNFKMFSISALLGAVLIWFLLLVVSIIVQPDSAIISVIVLAFLLPTAVGVSIIGYPVFKYFIPKFSNICYFANVLVSGSIACLGPVLIAGFVLHKMFPTGTGVVNYLNSLYPVIFITVPILLLSSTLYWAWSKNA
tara:strand:+ start:3019 stop:3435 length:417 start_codon:yes stop_codon:yes gene_type:complete